MKNPFTSLFRARDKPKNTVSTAPSFYFGTSGSGKSVNAQTAIQLSTVYACVRVIAETVASLPLGVYEKYQGQQQGTGSYALSTWKQKISSPCARAATIKRQGVGYN